MKVLFVTGFYEYNFGGAELVMRTLRRSLADRGHHIDVLCLEGGTQPQSGNVWRIPPPAFLRSHPQLLKRAIIFLNNSRFDRFFLRRIDSLSLPLSSYDLVHGHDIHSVVLARYLAERTKTKLGLTVQDNVPREFAPGALHPWLAALVRANLHRRDRSLQPCLRQFDWITTPSQHVSRRIQEFLKPDAPPVFTIYSPHPGDRLPLPQPLVKSVEPRLLFMGRLSSEKGIDLLLEALAGFELPFQLTILGLDGPLKQLVAATATKDSRIRLRPPVPHNEVPAILLQHDVVCCPSLWNDPLPGSVIEARLYGRAILATNLGGIPEILHQYRKAALVDANSRTHAQLVKSLQHGVAKVIDLMAVSSDPAEEVAFRRRFSPEHFTDQFEALYATGIVPSVP